MPETSSTNTQIAGVDEADLVEIAGDTLYSLAHGRLSIVRGFAEVTPELVSQVSVTENGQTAGMYLLVIGLRLSSRRLANHCEQDIKGSPLDFLLFFSQSQTTVTVLNVSDPTAVSVVTEQLLTEP